MLSARNYPGHTNNASRAIPGDVWVLLATKDQTKASCMKGMHFNPCSIFLVLFTLFKLLPSDKAFPIINSLERCFFFYTLTAETQQDRVGEIAKGLALMFYMQEVHVQSLAPHCPLSTNQERQL